jgi:hypothetical protein
MYIQIQPLVALLAGILILIMPRFLNYFCRSLSNPHRHPGFFPPSLRF